MPVRLGRDKAIRPILATGALGLLEPWTLSRVLGLAFRALGIEAWDFGLRLGLMGLGLWRRRPKSKAQKLDLENRDWMPKVRNWTSKVRNWRPKYRYWISTVASWTLMVRNWTSKVGS